MSDEQFEAWLRAAEHDDPTALKHLFTILYRELHRVARRELRRNGQALTLGTTTLLHEVYLNLRERHGTMFPDRAHFLAYAGRAMRGLILNYARSGRALKRGGGFEITSLQTDVAELAAVDSAELQRLNDAIEELAALEPRIAQVVDLKYFGGLSFGDIATLWNISERTVQRDWEKARLFLHRAVSDIGQSSLPAASMAGRDVDVQTDR